MNKSKQISLGAMISVVSIVLMYATTLLPTVRIFLVSLASFLIAILIIESSISTALISFVSTSILGILLVPNKLSIVPYVTFLGYYAVIKSYIESLNNLILEWIIKLIVFNIALYVNYLLITTVLNIEISFPFAIGLVVLSLQVLFIIYDYVFSMFISYYNERLRKYIK